MQNTPPKKADQSFFLKVKSFPKIVKSPSQTSSNSQLQTCNINDEAPNKTTLISSNTLNTSQVDLTSCEQQGTSELIDGFEKRLKQLKAKASRTKTKIKKENAALGINKLPRTRRRCVKSTSSSKFTINVFCYEKSLDNPPKKVFTKDSFSPKSSLDEILPLLKYRAFLCDSHISPSESFYEYNKEESMVVAIDGVPLFPKTKFESLLEMSQDNILNLTVFSDSLWKEFIQKKAEHSNHIQEEHQDNFTVDLDSYEDISQINEKEQKEEISILVKSSVGESHKFENVSLGMTIEQFYSTFLRESSIWQEGFKLHFDCDVLLPASQSTFDCLGIEDGDSLDYF